MFDISTYRLDGLDASATYLTPDDALAAIRAVRPDAFADETWEPRGTEQVMWVWPADDEEGEENGPLGYIALLPDEC